MHFLPLLVRERESIGHLIDGSTQGALADDGGPKDGVERILGVQEEKHRVATPAPAELDGRSR
eukprot:3977518-Alexandrium_andersonii.AAC.1